MSVLTKDTYIARGIITNPLPYHKMNYTIANKVVALSGGIDDSSYSLTLGQSLTLMPAGTPLDAPYLGVVAEHITMPFDVIANVLNKSTNARLGIIVPPTDIEAGWIGHLTVEVQNLTMHTIHLPIGYPIAAVRFHQLDKPVRGYSGKYQNQPMQPVPAK